jgi:hypothetical protein
MGGHLAIGDKREDVADPERLGDGCRGDVGAERSCQPFVA